MAYTVIVVGMDVIIQINECAGSKNENNPTKEHSTFCYSSDGGFFVDLPNVTEALSLSGVADQHGSLVIHGNTCLLPGDVKRPLTCRGPGNVVGVSLGCLPHHT